jgi:hypothetical protein
MALAAFCILTSLFVTATMVVTAYQNAKLAQEEDAAMGVKPSKPANLRMPEPVMVPLPPGRAPILPTRMPLPLQPAAYALQRQSESLDRLEEKLYPECSGCGAKPIKDGRCLYCGGPR